MTKPKRALWLINHSTLRQFEVPILRSFGYEVFLPKIFTYNEGNLSASVDYTYDADLSIPTEDLEALNQHDFYAGIFPNIRRIINAHFEIVFFAFFPEQLAALVREFDGILVLRPFGLSETTYTDLTVETLGRFFVKEIERVEDRFWFGQAYPHLAEVEKGIYRRKAITFPIGLSDASPREEWNGSDSKILFICPRIGSSPYFKNIYEAFKRDFGDLPLVIGGVQPIPVPDPRVTGFLARAEYDDLIRNARVMFYPSQEPRHVHYHPFEAIRKGMPLIFMANGMLDRLGGIGQPGRCETTREARHKIKRVLNNDRGLIRDIKREQVRLLESLKPENCESAWRAGFERIYQSLEKHSGSPVLLQRRKRRIAVIVPVGYRGGSLRGAKLLARAIAAGSHACGDDIDVIFGHLDDPICYPKEEFEDLPKTIKRRPYRWLLQSHAEAVRATAYAGFNVSLASPVYQIPDDGINQFTDCDLWIIVSDRLEWPLLPVRPYLLMVYDYLQRFQTFLDEDTNQRFVSRAHAAEAVMVTTEFTARDARQFAGIPAKKIKKVPMLAPEFGPAKQLDHDQELKPYFLWTTNLALHKNHQHAFKALRLYYENYDGLFQCRVTGVDTDEMLDRDVPHLKVLRDILGSSIALKDNLKLDGELADQTYRNRLRHAAFLWHPARIDNGTFSVVEAAHFAVPALSSDYPAMQEINKQFRLNLTWMDPDDPNDMAQRLKQMEMNLKTARSKLPSVEILANQSVDRLASAYWKIIGDYL